ncbi:MAG TPA: L-threonylcarbamoyladenylate synthase [Steroidobacteraceae bacterium]|nr:L-threonylcarbamoyladenylate synthase [Steroidobacteraceae bacterium]
MVRATQTEIEEAVEVLRAGDLVVFPTETVYGLGANASDPAAVRKIFQVKGRPTDHPVIVHLDNPRYLHRWVSNMPAAAEKLAARFWPGPLTLILPKAEKVNDIVTGGQDSIGIRVPSHPIAQQLLTAFGGGIAAPSANRFGRLSPTKPEHVRDELGTAIQVILDGGESPIGLESTIVSCLGNEARLLRPGFITRSQLEQVVGKLAEGGVVPRVSGDRRLHYAPSTPLAIVASDDLERYAGEFVARQEKVAVLAMRPPLDTQRNMTWINAGKKPDAYAHNLYNHLRTLDSAGCARILVQELPADERWAAILDRLQRASGIEDGDSLELSAG